MPPKSRRLSLLTQQLPNCFISNSVPTTNGDGGGGDTKNNKSNALQAEDESRHERCGYASDF